jgi:hypothetical protein
MRPRTHLRQLLQAGGVAAIVTAIVAIVCVVPAPPAAAAPELSATPTTTARVGPGSTTTLDGLSVSNGSGTLQATLSTTDGELSFPTTTGLTLGYNNLWTGRSSVTFTGSQADINAALAAVQLVAPNTTTTARVELTVLENDGDYFYLPSSGHFYRYFNAGSISWPNADAAARGESFRGQPGYLVTIPDATTNDFLSHSLPGAVNLWTAGVAYDDRTFDGSTYAKVWKWAEGADQSPIQGTTFTVCTNETGACQFVSPGSFFSSWAGGEPNMSGPPPERYLGTNYDGVAGMWNDFNENPGNVTGYVVEYGGKTNEDPALGTGFAGVVTASSDVLVAAAPTAPAAPTIQATAGDASVTLTWTPPANGGATISSYEVQIDEGSWVPLATTESSAVVDGTIVYTRTGVVAGLANGVPSSFRVRAVNSAGAGAQSNSATATPVGLPDAPTALTATPGNASVTVDFDPPADTGGTAILDYTVVASPGGASATCSAAPCSVGGLTNGTEYSFRATARTSVGSSVASAAVIATPRTVPTAPRNLVASRGNASAVIHFHPPASDGGAAITGYTISTSPATSDTACAGSPCTVTGLTNGVSYTFDVVATNAAGDGPAGSSGAITPATTPGAPTGVTVSPGDEQVTVEFDAPSSDGGRAITGYVVAVTPGSMITDCDASPCVVPGLTNGTSYSFTVRASNAIGDGPDSSTVTATPAAVPTAPGNPTAVAGDESAAVSFDAPASNGGAAITGYTVTASPGGATETCTGSPCTVDGLTNGTSYTFTVTATNAAGVGGTSAPSNAVTPSSVPGAPTSVTATRGDGTATVSFVAPVDDGGSAITGYTVTSTPGGVTASCAASPCEVDGLANGVAYTFAVTASNGSGQGPASVASLAVTPAGAPMAPAALDAQRADRSIVLSFVTPNDNGEAITGYEVSLDGGATWEDLDVRSGALASAARTPVLRAAAPATTYATVTGLTNGTTYEVSVRALNAIGAGPAATSDPVVPAGRPGAPVITDVTAGVESVTVTFVPGDPNGDPVSVYTLTATPGGQGVTCTASPCTLRGLTAGTAYTFSLTASNGVGASTAAVSASPVVPEADPAAARQPGPDARADRTAGAVDGPNAGPSSRQRGLAFTGSSLQLLLALAAALGLCGAALMGVGRRSRTRATSSR